MGSTSLTLAAQGGHLETVRLLLKMEADVQAVTKASCARKRAQELAVLLDLDTRDALTLSLCKVPLICCMTHIQGLNPWTEHKKKIISFQIYTKISFNICKENPSSMCVCVCVCVCVCRVAVNTSNAHER